MSDEVLKATVAAWEKSGHHTSASAKALGITHSSMQNRLKRARERFGALGGIAAGPAQANTKGRSLSEFRETHDKSFIVPKKIREALKALGNGWDYEQSFAKLAGIGLGDLSAFRSMFDEHVVVVEKSKRAWAGTKATAERMREMTR
ncbi:MAG: hypothetical protein A3E01_08360 [Gammaproteobacteria bacterium RIFCSPHIGHO2_12_FULL_63_22]|nr:MAG: hypothetical protein A3E01_08360 [Gammaproteobacteria bacterium RIFCSPHIGHO2_12_FULL_63_22]